MGQKRGCAGTEDMSGEFAQKMDGSQIRKGRLKGRDDEKAKVMTRFHFNNAPMHHLELAPWILLANLACSGRLGICA